MRECQILLMQERESLSLLKRSWKTLKVTPELNNKEGGIGLKDSQGALCHLQLFELGYSRSAKLGQFGRIGMRNFISGGTTDCFFFICEYSCSQNRLSPSLLIKTGFPIASCLMEWKQPETISVYLADIYGSVYSFSMNNPSHASVYDKINVSKSTQTLILQQPLLLFRQERALGLITLGGQLKTFSEDLQTELSVEFGRRVSSACTVAWENKSRILGLVCLVFENKHPPYLFREYRSEGQYISFFGKIKRFYQDSMDYASKIVQICYDTKTATLVSSNELGNISLYNIEQEEFEGCDLLVTKLRFKMGVGAHHFIERIHSNYGKLFILTKEKFQLFDISQVQVVTQKLRANMLQWALLLPKSDTKKDCKLILAKGFNFQQKEQCKIGKPNLHIYSLEFT